MPRTLYGSYVSPFTCRVVIQIRAKGLDIPLVDPPDDIHSNAYREINPLGKIPALDDDGQILPESEVICEYLERQHPEPSLLGRTAQQSARIRLVARIADIYVMNALLPLFPNMNPETRDTKVVDAAVAATRTGLHHLDHYISEGPYAVLEELTLADCATAPFLFYATSFLPMFGVSDPLDDVPRVAAYWSSVEDDSHVKAVLAEMRQALGFPAH